MKMRRDLINEIGFTTLKQNIENENVELKKKILKGNKIASKKMSE